MYLFEIGDVVELKSGSPKMTTSLQFEDSSISCCWFFNGKMNFNTFQLDQLKDLEYKKAIIIVDIGNIVELKSGSPAMAVIEFRTPDGWDKEDINSIVRTTWNQSGILCTGVFHVNQLKSFEE